jgi:general secretion pathway protein G
MQADGIRERRERARLAIVLAIIGALLTVVVAGVSMGRFAIPKRVEKTQDTKIQLAKGAIIRNGPIARALESCKRDTGKYPGSDEGLRALFSLEAESGDPGYRGPYLEGTFEELQDPWGNAFEYRCPGQMNPGGYDLWSRGPDGKNDSGAKGSDDIKNWVDK